MQEKKLKGCWRAHQRYLAVRRNAKCDLAGRNRSGTRCSWNDRGVQGQVHACMLQVTGHGQALAMTAE